MKNLYLSLKQGSWLRFLALTIIGLVTAASAFAETEEWGTTKEGKELKLGVEYSVPGDMEDYLGYFTPTSSGVLTFYNKYVSFEPYADANHTQAIDAKYVSYVGGVTSYTMDVEAGTTYYFYVSWNFDAGTFKLEMDSADAGISLVSKSVGDGAEISVSGDARLEYLFSANVAADKATISSGSNSKELNATNGYLEIHGAYIFVLYGDVLQDWYKAGTLKKGDEIVVKLEGVRDANNADSKYNSDGVLEATYTAAGAPLTLVSAKALSGNNELKNTQYAPTNFLSYYRDNDDAAVFEFTFSDPLDTTKGTYLLTYGSKDAGDWYEENAKTSFSNDNKTVTLDFRGTKHDYQEMSENKTNYGEIYIELHTITGADGQLAYTGTSGTVGSFSFPFKYSYLISKSAADFSEADLNGTNPNIYVSDYADVEFTGLSFSWKDNGETKTVVIDKADLKIEEADGGATISFTTPSEIGNHKNVLVSFVGLSIADGADHSSDFTKLLNAANVVNADDLKVTYEPNMEGDIPGSCEELTLTFPGYDKVAYGAGYALLRGRSTNVFATLDVPTEVSGNTIKQPIKDIAKADVYTVTFPEGYFELGDDAISPEFIASFMVDPELLVDKTAVTDPANGAVVSPIDQITVTIPGTDFLNNSWNYKATISKDGGTPVELGETKYGEADNQIIQPLGGTAQEDGEYTVTFPAGFFVLGEDGDYESEEIVVKFTVLNVNTGIEENAIVETIEKLHIVYAGATKVTLTDVRATIKTADAEDVELDAASYDYDVYNAIYQPLKTKAAATYTVTFPAGYVKLTYPAEAAQGKVKTLANEGEIVKDSPEFTVTFTTTKECGISDLTVDSDSDAVYYNLNGVQIVNPTTGVYLIRRGNTVTKKVIK